MRTRLCAVLLGLATAAACSNQTPGTSQPVATAPAESAPAAETAGDGTPGAAPAEQPAVTPPGSALTPTPTATPPPAAAVAADAAPSAARGTAPAAPRAPAAPAPPPAPRFREVTLAAGTELPLRLDTALASDASSVEDAVRASLRRALVVDDVTVLPAGTDLRGVVTSVQRSAKVKGRASLAFRFTTVTVGDEAYDIRTSSVSRQAAGTKKKDATKIGIGAGAGAIIGGIVGGGKGAAVGTAVGAGAGTGAVLATRGDEVRLAAGTPVTVRLTDPLTLRVPLD
jgi:hypothetical protein